MDATKDSHVSAAGGVAGVVLDTDTDANEGRRDGLLSKSSLARREGHLRVLEAALEALVGSGNGRDGSNTEDKSRNEGEGDHDDDG
jgi:hypothetical protein